MTESDVIRIGIDRVYIGLEKKKESYTAINKKTLFFKRWHDFACASVLLQ